MQNKYKITAQENQEENSVNDFPGDNMIEE